MKVALAGPGAFGVKHLDSIAVQDNVDVVALIGRTREKTRAVADDYGVTHAFTDLEDALALPEVDAVILCTPTQQHANEAVRCMRAGKHVQVEIPLADSLPEAQRVADVQRETGLVCLVGHTRRFNPSHQWVRRRIDSGDCPGQWYR